MTKPKTKKQWLQRHVNDPYVQEAQRLGYRSRAAFKLIEIQERMQLVKPGMKVVDLGAAPGGWSELLAKWVGPKGKVIAVDILEIDPIPGVEIIQGDITDADIFAQVETAVGSQGADLVVADIAPNISGLRSVDQPKIIGLAETVIAYSQRLLKPGGALVFKLFQGAGVDQLIKNLRKSAKDVKIIKPKASRATSKEIYIQMSTPVK